MTSLTVIIGVTVGLTALLTCICIFLRQQQAPMPKKNQSTKGRFQERGNDNSAVATAVATTVATSKDSALKSLQTAVGSSPEKLRSASPNRMKVLQSV